MYVGSIRAFPCSAPAIANANRSWFYYHGKGGIHSFIVKIKGRMGVAVRIDISCLFNSGKICCSGILRLALARDIIQFSLRKEREFGKVGVQRLLPLNLNLLALLLVQHDLFQHLHIQCQPISCNKPPTNTHNTKKQTL